MISAWIARAYLWACELLYYQLAAYYDLVSWVVSGGQWRRWQLGVWEWVDGERVLELGCGTGAMLVAGAQRGKQMIGVDSSPAMLTIAAKRVAIARSDTQLIQGAGQGLPLASGSFGTVMTTFPAGYILAARTLSEVHRVLRPNARFVLLGLWVDLHAGVLARLIPVFYSRPSEKALRQIAQRVEEAGFVTTWVRQRHGIFTVGVLVAQRDG